jgi:hypothetical protein
MSVIQFRPVAVLLLILAGIGISAPLRAQSLADVAKKEEERRKKLPIPAKVYTNKDLTAVPAGTPVASPPTASSEPSTSAAAPADTAKEGKGSVKDQAYWSGRRKALQDKLDRDESFLLALQTRINSLTADFVNRDDPVQRAGIERERLKAVADLARLQQDLVNDKKALGDLDEEARRAGVPPGWLR